MEKFGQKIFTLRNMVLALVVITVFSGCTTAGEEIVDSDDDLLSNDKERELLTGIFLPDSDGDGVLDGMEYANGTDPTTYDLNSDDMEIFLSSTESTVVLPGESMIQTLVPAVPNIYINASDLVFDPSVESGDTVGVTADLMDSDVELVFNNETNTGFEFNKTSFEFVMNDLINDMETDGYMQSNVHINIKDTLDEVGEIKVEGPIIGLIPDQEDPAGIMDNYIPGIGLNFDVMSVSVVDQLLSLRNDEYISGFTHNEGVSMEEFLLRRGFTQDEIMTLPLDTIFDAMISGGLIEELYELWFDEVYVEDTWGDQLDNTAVVSEIDDLYAEKIAKNYPNGMLGDGSQVMILAPGVTVSENHLERFTFVEMNALNKVQKYTRMILDGHIPPIIDYDLDLNLEKVMRDMLSQYDVSDQGIENQITFTMDEYNKYK